MSKNPSKSERKCEIQAKIKPKPNQAKPESSRIKPEAENQPQNPAQAKPKPAKSVKGRRAQASPALGRAKGSGELQIPWEQPSLLAPPPLGALYGGPPGK